LIYVYYIKFIFLYISMTKKHHSEQKEHNNKEHDKNEQTEKTAIGTSDPKVTNTQESDSKEESAPESDATTSWESVSSFQVQWHKLVDTVKELLKKWHARKIVIKDGENNVVLSIPMTVWVVAVVLWPIVAILAAVASFVAKYTIEITKPAWETTQESDSEPKDS